MLLEWLDIHSLKKKRTLNTDLSQNWSQTWKENAKLWKHRIKSKWLWYCNDVLSYNTKGPIYERNNW